MMLSRTLLSLLSIAIGTNIAITPATLAATDLGHHLTPSKSLASNYLGQSKASNKSNEQLFEKLALSPSQIKKVQAIYDKYEPEIIKRRRAIVAAKEELNNSSFAASQQKIDKLKLELAAVKNKYASAMQAVLTTEQWAKMQQLKKERHNPE
jgi:Spy/CpxP family protein refolding chaperone